MIVQPLLIYGANPSGIAAAWRAAQMGVPCYLIEPTGWFGGMWAGGLSQTDRNLALLRWGAAVEMERRFGVTAGLTKGTIFPTPQNAATTLMQMITDFPLITLVMNAPVTNVVNTLLADGTRIQTTATCGGVTYNFGNWSDHTDEGDFAAAAGITMQQGRESSAMTGEPTAGVTSNLVVAAKSYDVRTGRRLNGITPRISQSIGQADHRVMAYQHRLIVTQDANRINWSDLNVTVNPEDYRSDLNIAVASKYTSFPASVGSTQLQPASTMPQMHDANNGGLGRIGLNAIGVWNDWSKLTIAQRAARANAYTLNKAGLLKCIATDPEWAALLPALVADTKTYGLPAVVDATGKLVAALYPNSAVPGFSPLMYVRESRRIMAQAYWTQMHDWSPAIDSVTEPVSLAGYTFDTHWLGRFALADGTIGFEGSGTTPTGVTATIWPIPFGAMKPRKSESRNGMVSRTLGGSRLGRVPQRLELTYAVEGDVCGMCGALAALAGGYTADLSYTSDLLPSLKAAGAIISVAGLT